MLEYWLSNNFKGRGPLAESLTPDLAAPVFSLEIHQQSIDQARPWHLEIPQDNRKSSVSAEP